MDALGGLAAAHQGTKALQEERVIGPDGLPIPLKDEFGNSLIDEHGHRLYQTTNDFNLLNEASSVLDGLSDWRQAARGESQAREAVGQAEQALALARASGDSEAIREAEASLDATRHGLVRAELDRTLAQNNAAARFTGAVDTFQNSRAADRLRAEQERQSQRATASLDGAKGLGRSLGTLAGLEALSDDTRTRLEEQSAALAAGERAYLDTLDSAEGDPTKIQQATEAFERLQEAIRTKGRSIVEEDQARMAAAGGPGAAGSDAAGPNASSAGAPPASFGVATVRAGMTVWEISMRTGVPVDRILEFNAQGGNALDPHHLKEGQQVYVPLGAGDVQARPRTAAEVQVLKDQANGANYFEGIRFRSPAEVEGDFARATSMDGPAPPAGPPRPVEEPSALDFIWRDFDWRSVGQTAFDAAADIGDSVGTFAQGFGSGLLDMAKGAVVGGAELAKLTAMQTMGTPEQRFQATMALAQIGIGAAEHLAESGRYLVHGVTNPGDVLDAMSELGIKGSAYELGRSTASAEGTVSSLYGMAGPIRSLGRRLLSEADEAAGRTSAGRLGETIDPKTTGAGEGGVNLLEPKQVQPKPQGVEFGKPRGGGGSSADRAYASQVTGGAEKAIYVNGVEFESVRGGVLIDAKRASAKGSFYDISGTDGFTQQFKIPTIVDQAQRQLRAIQGQGFKGIRWEVADARVAQQLRDLFRARRIPITVVHTPKR